MVRVHAQYLVLTTERFMKKPRLLIGDEQRLFLDGLQRLLSDDFDVIGTAEDGRELLRATNSLRPDVVVMEMILPLLNGVEVARQLSKSCPQTKVVFATACSDSRYVTEAFRAGASGYVTKKCFA